MIKHYFKGLYKITCYKTKSNLFQFFYHSERFFFLLIKAFDHFEKLARFHRQVFIVNKNGEILKILNQHFSKSLQLLKLFWPF